MPLPFETKAVNQSPVCAAYLAGSCHIRSALGFGDGKNSRSGLLVKSARGGNTAEEKRGESSETIYECCSFFGVLKLPPTQTKLRKVQLCEECILIN